MIKNVYVVPKDSGILLEAVNATITAGTPTVCITQGVTEKSEEVWVVSTIAPHSKYEYLGDWIEDMPNFEIDLHTSLVDSGEPSCIIIGLI